MAILALVLIGVWLTVVAGLRPFIYARRGGDVRVLRPGKRRGAAQRWAGIVSSIGFALAVAAPTAELLGWAPVASLDRTAIRATGAVTVLVGIAASFAAQLAMGESWRADVDPDVRTALVTTGPFRWVRNPVFTATGVVWIGLAALVPHPLSLAMLVASLLAIEIQVRWAEEPYLQRVHAAEWRDYAARTGRFVPGLGRLRRS